MNESSVATAKEKLKKALDRLFLDDIDEDDIEKALANIEDAKNVLQ